MAVIVENHKVLGQLKPSSAVDTQLYKPAAGIGAIVSTITVCNQGSTINWYHIKTAKHNPSGNEVFLEGFTSIGPNESHIIQCGVTLSGDNQDEIIVYDNGGICSFTANGVERTLSYGAGEMHPKILGQVIPSANTTTTLYTGVADTVLSTLAITNLNSTTQVCRAAISVGGGAIATKDYFLFDIPLSAGSGASGAVASPTVYLHLGMGMQAGDIFRVRSDASSLGVVFNLFGMDLA